MYQIFASMPNSGPNSVFVFGRIVSSERIRIVSLYSAASDVYGRLHSVGANCSRSDRLIMGDEWRGVGMHRIPNFGIRPDPDPAGSVTIGSGRIRIFTGSSDFGSGQIRIFTRSGCNLIQDQTQSWITPNDDISSSQHQFSKKRKQTIFHLLCCCYMN